MNVSSTLKCDNPYTVKLTQESSGKHGINHAPVPCGRCYNCKQTRVAQWSFRLQKELECSTSAYFVTLTYDPLHVPLVKGRYPMTLCKNSEQNATLSDAKEKQDRSLQAFFKRLRYYEQGARVQYDPKSRVIKTRKPIKYYACGEYGGRRKRPHYHIILFNIAYPESIYKAWSTAVVEKGVTVDFIPFGQIDVDEDVNQRNIDYTLKYICKTDKKAGEGRADFRIPEFSLMSKGLGKNFLTSEIQTFYNKRLDISYVVNSNGVKISMPKYYVDQMMTQETKDDRIGYIKRAVDEAEAKDRTTAEQKQAAKFVRQQKMNNYSKRREL